MWIRVPTCQGLTSSWAWDHMRYALITTCLDGYYHFPLCAAGDTRQGSQGQKVPERVTKQKGVSHNPPLLETAWGFPFHCQESRSPHCNSEGPQGPTPPPECCPLPALPMLTLDQPHRTPGCFWTIPLCSHGRGPLTLVLSFLLFPLSRTFQAHRLHKHWLSAQMNEEV